MWKEEVEEGGNCTVAEVVVCSWNDVSLGEYENLVVAFFLLRSMHIEFASFTVL